VTQWVGKAQARLQTAIGTVKAESEPDYADPEQARFELGRRAGHLAILEALQLDTDTLLTLAAMFAPSYVKGTTVDSLAHFKALMAQGTDIAARMDALEALTFQAVYGVKGSPEHALSVRRLTERTG
jgi:hypothetical protein